MFYSSGLSYFMLDCSYINILLQFGVVLFCALVVLQIIWLIQDYQTGRLFFIMIYIIICIQCAVEHHYLDIAYNPLLFFTLLNQKMK